MLKKLMLALTLLGANLHGSGNAALIINEVYPGGGSGAAGTAFTRDYVELYNTGLVPIDLSGWKVSYASATGNFVGTTGLTNDVVVFGAGSFIGANDFLLLVTGSAGAAGTTITNANFFGASGASLSGTAGSLSIFDASNAQIDVIGYGTSATNPLVDANGLAKAETARAPAPTSGNTSSLGRTTFIDTNNNSLDFINQAPSPTVGTNSLVVTAVPEPTSVLLTGIVGVACLAVRYRRKTA